MSKTKHYVLFVFGCIDPSLRGPYTSCDKRDEAAKKIRNSEGDENGVFWLDVTDKGKVSVGSYSGAFMEG